MVEVCGYCGYAYFSAKDVIALSRIYSVPVCPNQIMHLTCAYELAKEALKANEGARRSGLFLQNVKIDGKDALEWKIGYSPP